MPKRDEPPKGLKSAFCPPSDDSVYTVDTVIATGTV